MRYLVVVTVSSIKVGVIGWKRSINKGMTGEAGSYEQDMTRWHEIPGQTVSNEKIVSAKQYSYGELELDQ